MVTSYTQKTSVTITPVAVTSTAPAVTSSSSGTVATNTLQYQTTTLNASPYAGIPIKAGNVLPSTVLTPVYTGVLSSGNGSFQVTALDKTTAAANAMTISTPAVSTTASLLPNEITGTTESILKPVITNQEGHQKAITMSKNSVFVPVNTPQTPYHFIKNSQTQVSTVKVNKTS